MEHDNPFEIVYRYFDNSLLGKPLIIMSSNNKLIRKGDMIMVSIIKPYQDCSSLISVSVLNRDLSPNTNCTWKFIEPRMMINSDDFDNFDWRQELDDIRNLSPYNFFHFESFEHFISSLGIDGMKEV